MIDSGSAVELERLLGNFVEPRKLGTIAGDAGMLRLSPGLVRIPDLSFISRARLAAHRRVRASILPLPPDLAIELHLTPIAVDVPSIGLYRIAAMACDTAGPSLLIAVRL
jgi:hypothetical protein